MEILTGEGYQRFVSIEMGKRDNLIDIEYILFNVDGVVAVGGSCVNNLIIHKRKTGRDNICQR